MAFNIGVDTGGTFTDAFIADDAGGHWTVKVPTTPHDLTVGLSDAIEACAQAVGLARHDLLRRTAVIRFSSTIATNTRPASSRSPRPSRPPAIPRPADAPCCAKTCTASGPPSATRSPS